MASDNVLATGDRAQDSEPKEIVINPPQELNFKTREEILNLRFQILESSPALLSGPYSAKPEIFSQVVDGKPWWGLRGTFVWGKGQKSIEGAAEESRFILNPLLLVGANPNSAQIWKTDQLGERDFADPEFPYCWLPKSLKWYPKESLAQVTYDVSSYNKKLSDYKDKLSVAPDAVNRFGLIAYNARDFGYNWISLDLDKSINITADKPEKEPVLIKQMIHCGGSCGFNGGCNNMSPAMPEIDYFRFKGLPARARILLWHDKPQSVNDRPDLIWLIDLR
jgi:hypothetical protein